MEIQLNTPHADLFGDEEGSLLFSKLERAALETEDVLPTDLSQETSMNQEETPMNEEETFSCLICYDDYPLSEAVVLPCSHTYCGECVQMFVFEFLQQGKVTDIRCPDPSCDSPSWTSNEIALVFSSPAISLTMPDGKVLTPKEIETRFVRFRMLADANLGGEAHRPCRSGPDCEGLLVVGDANSSEKSQGMLVACRLCETEHCAECFFIHQEGEGCKDAKKRTQKEDYKKTDSYKRRREFRIAAKAFFPTIFTRCSLFIKPNVKRCPKCHKYIEKWYGCRYMRCASCKTSFCWLCDATQVQHGNRNHCKLNKATWPIRLILAVVFSAVYIPVMLLPFIGMIVSQRLGVQYQRGPQLFLDNFYFCNERLAGFPY